MLTSAFSKAIFFYARQIGRQSSLGLFLVGSDSNVLLFLFQMLTVFFCGTKKQHWVSMLLLETLAGNIKKNIKNKNKTYGIKRRQRPEPDSRHMRRPLRPRSPTSGPSRWRPASQGTTRRTSAGSRPLTGSSRTGRRRRRTRGMRRRTEDSSLERGRLTSATRERACESIFFNFPHI
jgi:hypothetical protein